jgi:hypothetical protein
LAATLTVLQDDKGVVLRVRRHDQRHELATEFEIAGEVIRGIVIEFTRVVWVAFDVAERPVNQLPGLKPISRQEFAQSSLGHD